MSYSFLSGIDGVGNSKEIWVNRGARRRIQYDQRNNQALCSGHANHMIQNSLHKIQA